MSKDKKSEEDRKAIEEWLAQGIKITFCPPAETTPEEYLVYKYKVGKRK